MIHWIRYRLNRVVGLHVWALPVVWRLSRQHRRESPHERALCDGRVAIDALARQRERRLRGPRFVSRDRD